MYLFPCVPVYPYGLHRDMSHQASIRPYLGIALGIAAVSTASIFIRLAQAPALVIAAYRLTIASLILAPLALSRYRQELRSLTRAELGLALVSGLFLGLHFATWISSLEYTSVASSVVLVATSPLFVALASPIFLHERLSRIMFIGIIVATAGGMIVALGDFGLSRNEVLGDVLALGGAIFAAGYFLIGRRLRARLSLIAYITLVYSTAAVILVALAVGTGQQLTGYPSQTYLFFVLLATVPQLIGHSSFNWALRYLPATFVAVTVLGEPIGSTILAYFILAEVPTPTKLLGGALILAGIYLTSRQEPEAAAVEAVVAEV